MGTTSPAIRVPEIAVPVATYTGWGCELRRLPATTSVILAGQKIDLRQTKADRLAVGDPRLSIEERYPTHRKIRQGGDARSEPPVSAAATA